MFFFVIRADRAIRPPLEMQSCDAICLPNFRRPSVCLAGEKEQKGEGKGRDRGEVKRAGGSDGIGEMRDEPGEDDDGKKGDGGEGVKGNKRCVRRRAFFFGPWWSSHRVITRDEEAYMSNLYSARSSVSKFEST